MDNSNNNSIEALKDLNENLTYENKKMGDFLNFLGVSSSTITDLVVNGNIEEWKTIFPTLKLYLEDFSENNEWENICEKLGCSSNISEVEISYIGTI